MSSPRLADSVNLAIALGLLSIGAAPGGGLTAQDIVPSNLGCGTRLYQGDQTGTRDLAGGFQLAIRQDSVDAGICVGLLRDRTGRIVFRSEGFGIRQDSASGMDIDGDGAGELVLELDSGGGNKCCHQFDVLTLAPAARLLFTFQWEGLAEFRSDASGDALLRSWEGISSASRGPFAGQQVMALRSYQFRRGRLVDVTPAQCRSIYAELAWLTDPPADSVARFRAISPDAEGYDATAESLAELIQVRMLQHIFCGSPDAALRAANAMWIPRDRARFVAEFRDMVTARYSEYVAALAHWR